MRIKLKVLNETAYSTRDLRRLFLAGMRAIGAEQPKTLVVQYSRTPPQPGLPRVRLDRITGEAIVGARPVWNGEVLVTPGWEGGRVWLRLPRGGYGMTMVDDLARVIIHELWHSLGWRHRGMPPDARMNTSWADGMTLAWQPAKRSLVDGTVALAPAIAVETAALHSKLKGNG